VKIEAWGLKGGAALLALMITAPSTAQTAPTGSDEFEAALGKTPVPRTRPVPSPSSRLGSRGAASSSIAPAGALPSHWIGVKSIDGQAWTRATSEAREGVLDPFAFMEKFYGPLPVPPGFRPVRCMNRLGDLIFTSGLSVSAEYDQKFAQPRDSYSRVGSIGITGLYSWADQTGKRVMARKMQEMESFYGANGFSRLPGDRLARILYTRSDFVAGTTFELRHNVTVEKDLCAESLPLGPFVRIRLKAPPLGKAPIRAEKPARWGSW